MNTENRISNLAKNKLRIHAELGVKSQLSIFEVAQLMDVLLFPDTVGVNQEKATTSLGFSLN